MSSTSEDSRSAAPFRELPSNECERRLGQHTIGRVAWNAPDGPQLLPVNYASTTRPSCSGLCPMA